MSGGDYLHVVENSLYWMSLFRVAYSRIFCFTFLLKYLLKRLATCLTNSVCVKVLVLIKMRLVCVIRPPREREKTSQALVTSLNVAFFLKLCFQNETQTQT